MQNDNYSFDMSSLIIQLANIQAQNATILKILSKNLSAEEQADYLLFMSYSLNQHTILALQGGQNPEGETLKRLSSEIEEKEKLLKQKGLITE